jgi:hypothetical protein
VVDHISAGRGPVGGLPQRLRLCAAFIAVPVLAAACLSLATAPVVAQTRADATSAAPAIIERHHGVARHRANKFPLREGDQAMVDGWPLYRSERAQAAFNATMATLKATDGPPPPQKTFKGCINLACPLTLPSIGTDGWLPPGRLWVSPTEYVLLVRSPNVHRGFHRRMSNSSQMRYLVFHEFQNSSRNTDVYDTLASHKGSVFVPLYMSKQARDVHGHNFVVVVQVAPYDVASIHASNFGSAGPGIEVAKNTTDQLEPLQGLAGIIVASIIKAAAPHLEVVNHRNDEGRPMLDVYRGRLASMRGRGGDTNTNLALPFVPATGTLSMAAARFEDLILKPGASPPIRVADRGVVARPAAAFATAAVAPSLPQLIGPIKLAVRPQRPATTAIAADPQASSPVPVSRWCFAGFCPN